MSRVSPASFACALTLSLFLPALSAHALPQTQGGDVKPPTSAPQNNAALNEGGTPVNPNLEKRTGKQATKDPDRMFKDVPSDSPLYASVNSLQQQGILTNYPEGYFRGRRPLTYYEFGIAAQRTVKGWDVMTLAPDGKTLQSVVALPRKSLSLEQAQALLSVWTEVRPEIAATSFGAAKTNLIIRTLQAYVNLLAKNPNKFGGMIFGGQRPKEPK